MAEKWIQKAIKKPGALRATAKRMKKSDCLNIVILPLSIVVSNCSEYAA